MNAKDDTSDAGVHEETGSSARDLAPVDDWLASSLEVLNSEPINLEDLYLSMTTEDIQAMLEEADVTKHFDALDDVLHPRLEWISELLAGLYTTCETREK